MSWELEADIGVSADMNPLHSKPEIDNSDDDSLSPDGNVADHASVGLASLTQDAPASVGLASVTQDAPASVGLASFTQDAPVTEQEEPDAYRKFKMADNLELRIILESKILTYLHEEEEAKAKGDWAYKRWQVATFMERTSVKAWFMGFVLINGILIGVQIDYGGSETAWEAVDSIFLFVFTVEVSFRLFGFSWLFFGDGWNVLDFAVVGAGILDWIVSAATGAASNPVFTTFRLLRIFRVIRIMGFFERLSKLVEAFFGALQDVIWVGLLVVIMLYIFAVVVTKFYGNHQQLDDAGVDSNDLFGSIPRSMATLVQIMTFDSWMSGITRPISNVYPSAWFIFIVWGVIGALGLLNLLTAIFIESLTTISRESSIKQRALAEMERKKVLKIVQSLFIDFDLDNSGTLDPREANLAIKKIEQTPEILEAFSTLGITSVQINAALNYADLNGDGIEYHEFIECLEIQDDSSQKKDTMQLSKQMSMIGHELKMLRQEVQALRDSQGVPPQRSQRLAGVLPEVGESVLPAAIDPSDFQVMMAAKLMEL